MRQDPEFESEASDPQLIDAFSRFSATVEQRMREGASLSGRERNHFYLNDRSGGFREISAISGLDHPADGRAAASLDFDRDGWLDFAVVNANTPQLQLFRNRIGERKTGAGAAVPVLAVRLVGGNESAAPNPKLSHRNAFGAIVEVTLGGVTAMREHRSSDGFAAQSSATLLFGLGAADTVDALRVRWPSGLEAEYGTFAAGSLVTLYENPAQSPDGTGVSIEAWGRSLVVPPAPGPTRRLDLAQALTVQQPAALRFFTTMASWCEACKNELPQVALLRKIFPALDLALFGVPVDEDDDADVLDRYRREQAPSYTLLGPLTERERMDVQSIVEAELSVDALPATIVTDREGRILHILDRLPSLSETRRWLAERS